MLIKDCHTGAEIFLKAVPLAPGTVSSPDLFCDVDLYKRQRDIAVEKRRRKAMKAINDPRTPQHLRNAILDFEDERRQMPADDVNRRRGYIAGEISGRADLGGKLQRRLLGIVLDNGPVSSVQPELGAPNAGFGPYPGKSAGLSPLDKALIKAVKAAGVATSERRGWTPKGLT